MHCDAIREALSAQLDDELSEAEAGAVAAHLATCAGCHAYAAALASLHRATRVRPAEPVPDLAARITAVAGDELPTRRASEPDWARAGLAVVALTQLVLALPAFLLGEGAGATVHVAREMGAFDVALAAGLLVVAWQPRRAIGLIPFALALAATITVGAVADIAAGRTGAGDEASHGLQLVGVGFVWALARAARRGEHGGADGDRSRWRARLRLA